MPDKMYGPSSPYGEPNICSVTKNTGFGLCTDRPDPNLDPNQTLGSDLLGPT